MELALLAPVIASLLFGILFLSDLAAARLEQQEVARFALWEAAARPLGDPSAFDSSAARVRVEVERRYGPLRGFAASASAPRLQLRSAGAPSSERVERPRSPLSLLPVLDAFGGILGALGDTQAALLRPMGFDSHHVGAAVEVGLSIDGSPLLGEAARSLELTPTRLEIHGETWALRDGGDVDLPGTGSELGERIDRIALLGIGAELFEGKGKEVLSMLPLHLGSQVVMQAYGDPGGDRSRIGCGGEDPLARSGRWENGKITPRDGMSPSRCFDTLPIEANGFGSGGGREGDPNYRMLRARGPSTMGCDVPQAFYPKGCGRKGGHDDDAEVAASPARHSNHGRGGGKRVRGQAAGDGPGALAGFGK